MLYRSKYAFMLYAFMLFRNFGFWFHLEEKCYFRSQKPVIYFTVENEGFTLKLLLCRTSFNTEKNVSIQRRRRKYYYILNLYLAYNIEHFPKTLYISGTSLVTKRKIWNWSSETKIHRIEVGGGNPKSPTMMALKRWSSCCAQPIPT